MTSKPPPGLTEEDFEAIEDAVMETARGRWFLREFARRARAADTGKLLEALGRIERVIVNQHALNGGFAPEHHAQALDERQSRFAEIAWTLRERGYDGAICTLIENEARALARLAEVMRGGGPVVEGDAMSALPAPAERGSEPIREPAVAAVDLPAVSVQEMPQATPPAPAPRPVPAAIAPSPAPYQSAPSVRDGRLAALAAIDALPAREKAALFA